MPRNRDARLNTILNHIAASQIAYAVDLASSSWDDDEELELLLQEALEILNENSKDEVDECGMLVYFSQFTGWVYCTRGLKPHLNLSRLNSASS